MRWLCAWHVCDLSLACFRYSVFFDGIDECRDRLSSGYWGPFPTHVRFSM